jgi:hypothetical protein
MVPSRLGYWTCCFKNLIKATSEDNAKEDFRGRILENNGMLLSIEKKAYL